MALFVVQTVGALHLHRRTMICPSDIARANAGPAWRAAMPMIRALVDELAARREVVVLQGGARVQPQRARGPIRIALPQVV